MCLLLGRILTKIQDQITLELALNLSSPFLAPPQRCGCWRVRWLGQGRGWSEVRIHRRAAWHWVLWLPPAPGTDPSYSPGDFRGCQGGGQLCHGHLWPLNSSFYSDLVLPKLNASWVKFCDKFDGSALKPLEIMELLHDRFTVCGYGYWLSFLGIMQQWQGRTLTNQTHYGSNWPRVLDASVASKFQHLTLGTDLFLTLVSAFFYLSLLLCLSLSLSFYTVLCFQRVLQ